MAVEVLSPARLVGVDALEPEPLGKGQTLRLLEVARRTVGVLLVGFDPVATPDCVQPIGRAYRADHTVEVVVRTPHLLAYGQPSALRVGTKALRHDDEPVETDHARRQDRLDLLVGELEAVPLAEVAQPPFDLAARVPGENGRRLLRLGEERVGHAAQVDRISAEPIEVLAHDAAFPQLRDGGFPLSMRHVIEVTHRATLLSKIVWLAKGLPHETVRIVGATCVQIGLIVG